MKILNISVSIFSFRVSRLGFYLVSRLEKKCCFFDETGTNRLEMVKCGANLVSDQKVVFSQKHQCDQNPEF